MELNLSSVKGLKMMDIMHFLFKTYLPSFTWGRHPILSQHSEIMYVNSVLATKNVVYTKSNVREHSNYLKS